MPFNDLLATCLLVAQHSYTEQGVNVSMQPQSGETVLFFHIDDQANNACSLRKHGYITGKICDLLVFYARKGQQRKVLCLVEMKRGQIADAAAKALAMHEDLAPHLDHVKQHFTWKVYIRAQGSAPRDTKRQKGALQKRLGRHNVTITNGETPLEAFLRE